MGVNKYLLIGDDALVSVPDLQSLGGVDCLLQALAVVVYFNRHGVPESFCFKGTDWVIEGVTNVDLCTAMSWMLPDAVISYFHNAFKLDYKQASLKQLCDIIVNGAGFEIEVGHFITMDTSLEQVFFQQFDQEPVVLQYTEEEGKAYWTDVELGVSSSESKRVDSFKRSIKDVIKEYVRVMETEKAREAEVRRAKQMLQEIERREYREIEVAIATRSTAEHDDR